MELMNDQLLSMFVERLSPMEKTCSFFVNHLHYRISSPINNVDNILVCLRTICHEPLENGRTQPFFFNNHLPPYNALSFYVLRLHVIDHNCHDLTIDRVINVTCHGYPSLNMFYVIKHHPRIL